LRAGGCCRAAFALSVDPRQITLTGMAAKTSKRNPARELLFGNLWEYDPAPETAAPHIDPRYRLFINGKHTEPKTKKYFDSISPRNAEKLSEIAQNVTDIRDKVDGVNDRLTDHIATHHKKWWHK
jgi:hypothetical protein